MGDEEKDGTIGRFDGQGPDPRLQGSVQYKPFPWYKVYEDLENLRGLALQAAVLELHERMKALEYGKPTFAWVRELEERISKLEAAANTHTGPWEGRGIKGTGVAMIDNVPMFHGPQEELEDLKARVARFVAWLPDARITNTDADGTLFLTDELGYEQVLAKLRELGLVKP